MSDWLMNDDGGDGYLGMDEPAMPDAAPAPPAAPGATAVAEPAGDAGGDWLGGDPSASQDAGDDWLGGAPQGGQSAGAAPVMDDQGDWMSGSAPAEPAPVVTPGGMAPQSYADPTPIAMGGDMSVTAPQLQQVQPTRRTLGGAGSSAAAGELSNLVLDVEVQVEVGLGNAALTVEEFLEMGRGSVVELDTPIDAPIELKVRGKLIARGQLVSINGSYGMRIIEMLNEEH